MRGVIENQSQGDLYREKVWGDIWGGLTEMEGMKKLQPFTILQIFIVCFTPCFAFGKFRVKMVPRAAYNEGLFQAYDNLDDLPETSEYYYNSEIGNPTKPENVGKYIIREKHFPYNYDVLYDEEYPIDQHLPILDVLSQSLRNKELKKKKDLEYLRYQANPILTNDELPKVRLMYIFFLNDLFTFMLDFDTER